MSLIRIRHQTLYEFDRDVGLAAHEIRLRPRPDCRTPIKTYLLEVAPPEHTLYWQQDPCGNCIVRAVFQEKARALEIKVELIADIVAWDPFDFYLEGYALRYPFVYPEWLRKDLAAYLHTESCGPLLRSWLDRFEADASASGTDPVAALVQMNHRLHDDVAYVKRLEAGIQSSEQTLATGKGSCRDSAWLLVQALRQSGLAARLVSGYLIEMETENGSSDAALHAWAEVYLPGAGWIGLDPTSGLVVAQAHIPLAAGRVPEGAAPVSGYTERCQAWLSFELKAQRLGE